MKPSTQAYDFVVGLLLQVYFWNRVSKDSLERLVLLGEECQGNGL